MKLLSLFFIFAIIAIGLASRKTADHSAAFLDHGEFIVQDKPDLPGYIADRHGNDPTHVTYSDIEEATTKRIYQ